MKIFVYLFFGALTISTLFFSCDGADHELGVDNLCYFQPQLIDYGGVCEGTITFTFMNEDTYDFFEWSYDFGNTVPVMSLQKNACYIITLDIPDTGDWEDPRCQLTYFIIKDDMEWDFIFEGWNGESHDFCISENCTL